MFSMTLKTYVHKRKSEGIHKFQHMYLVSRYCNLGAYCSYQLDYQYLGLILIYYQNNEMPLRVEIYCEETFFYKP